MLFRLLYFSSLKQGEMLPVFLKNFMIQILFLEVEWSVFFEENGQHFVLLVEGTKNRRHFALFATKNRENMQ